MPRGDIKEDIIYHKNGKFSPFCGDNWRSNCSPILVGETVDICIPEIISFKAYMPLKKYSIILG